MGNPAIIGLPEGATLKPIQSSGIEGLPPGATLKPLSSQESPTESPNPLSQIPEADVINQGLQGAKEGLGDVWDQVKGIVTHPLNAAGGAVGSAAQSYDAIKNVVPVLHAYENARSQGKGVIDSLSAANQQAKEQNDAFQTLRERADEFKKTPTVAQVRLVADAAAAALAYYGAKKIPGLVGDAAEALQKPAEESPIHTQVVKDSIKRVLGAKADSDVVNEAFNRMDKQGVVSRMISPTENELKLVKPKVDADLTQWNAKLDSVLANEKTPVQNAKTRFYAQMSKVSQDIVNGVGTDKISALKAVRDVSKAFEGKLQDEDMSALELNDVKRLAGDEVKNFDKREADLTRAELYEQKAYKQAYFTLRDLVSEVSPESKELNTKISKAIDLQALLNKKFPHLETTAEAQASHAGVKQQNIKNAGIKTAKRVGLGLVGVEAARKLLE